MGHLAIYLNDHLAAATAAVELAGRARGSMGDGPAGELLGATHEELRAEAGLLRESMASLAVRPDPLKRAAGWLGERSVRLKPNGSLLRRSPLSDVVELEGLAMLSEANLAALRTLHALAERDGRVRGLDLDGAIRRAEARRAPLEEQRAAAAARALR